MHLVIHLDDFIDRPGRRGVKMFHPARFAVYALSNLVHFEGVFQLVQPAHCRTGADCNENLCPASDRPYAVFILRTRDRTFDDRDIVIFAGFGHRFTPLDHIDSADQIEDFLFEVDDLKLTTLATGEIKNCYSRFTHIR